jgi:hypothetical protein
VNSLIPKAVARNRIEAIDKEEQKDERTNTLPEDVR